jgi:hypothetical protein
MLAVLRVGALRRLLAAYTINQLGDWMAEIAIALLVLRATGNPLAVTLVWVLGRFLPAAPGPWLAARVGARRPGGALRALLAAEGALFAAAALCAHTGRIVPLYAIVLLDGILGVAARGLLKAALVGHSGPAGLLREGNALLTGAAALCCAAGPLLGGVVVAIAGPSTGLLLDALSFLVAGLALGGLASAPAEAATDDASAATRLRTALAHVRRHPVLRRLCAVEGLAAVAFSMILPIEIVFVTRALHGSASQAGLVLGAWGAGAVAGSALLPRLRRGSLIGLLYGGMALMGAAYAGMGLAPGVAVAAAFSALGGVGNGLTPFAFLSAVQERTPSHLQTEVNALIEALENAAPGIGFVLGGVCAAALSLRATYLVAAVAVAGLLVAAVSSLYRGLDTPSVARVIDTLSITP